MASTLYIEIRGDYTQFQKDLARVRGIARQNGEAISNALGNAISPDKAVKGISRLTQSLRQAHAAAAAGVADPAIKGLEELARTAGMSAREMGRLQRAMVETARQNSLSQAFADIQRQTGYTHSQMARLKLSLGDVKGGFLDLAKTGMTIAKGLGMVAAIVGTAVKSMADAVISAQNTEKAFTSITGSASAAKEELAFIRGEAERLGLEYGSTAEAAKTFYAAASNSSLKSQAREIFTAFSEAGTALSLTGEQMNGVFLALGQMISKGKVSSEELRKQIGERLPGAFQMAAQSIGVSTAELDKLMASGKLTAEDLLPKMARAMHDEFGQAAEDSAHGAQQAVNRLTNAWEDFKSSLDQNFIVGVIDTITGAVKTLAGVVSNLGRAVQLFGEFTAGNLSLSEYATMGPEKAAAWLKHRHSKEGVTELRDKEFAELKRMLESQQNRPEHSSVRASDTLIAAQREKVQKLNSELAAINAKAEKESQAAKRQAAKEAVRIEQQKQSEIKTVMDKASKSYADAMKDNITQRLAVLQNEDSSAIKAQEAAYKQGSMSLQQYEQRKTDIQAEYAKKRQELTDRENRKAAGGGKKASSSAGAGKDISQLEAQINRLRMSGSEFKEWELTNVTIPRMLRDFPGATEKVREFYEAQRKAFADEAAKEAQEENRKQMSDRARLLKELSELTGDVNMGQEAQNLLLEQQAQAYSETLGPSMQAYIDKWKELQQLRNSDSFADKLKVGFMDSYKTAMDVGSNLVTAANGWADSFASSLASMAESGKVSFSDLAKSIVSDLVKMTTRMMIFWAIGKAIGMFTRQHSHFDMGSLQAATPSGIWAQGGYAHGGAFTGGTLSRYSGTVVDRPTLFTYGSSLKKFARGAGLMGEAGPEAILPLTRRNGRLGVEASGSSPRVNVVINNMAGADVQTEQRQNADGSVDIEATILSAVNRDLSRRGGQLNRTMRNQWGGRSIVTQR